MFTINEEGLKVFEISRATWLRGEGSRASRLLRAPDFKMCCLGSFALAADYCKSTIMGLMQPSELVGHGTIKNNFKWLFDGTGYPEKVLWEVMECNDDPDTDDEYKMVKLTELFRAHGYLPVFVD